MISHMTTLANSIIGVSVLAMPYCFKQCGIILATIMLLLSSILSRLACHLLIKSAVMSRRRNYEFLAFHAFGNMGKFLAELFIIGFLLGTCIAYFVVIGDLGPEIVGKIFNRNPEDIRTSLLVTSAVFIVLPLGLLRNIDSLSSVCTATIVFYIILVLKVISESISHVLAEDWYAHVYYWRPAGILQCVPIFSMALFCQTQLFEIYEAIPNATLDKMNAVVKGALNICTSVYLCVGFFGYIAFCTQPFTGNILMSFEPNLTSEAMKIGFVFSVAFSFPLVIFPCRASLNSLLYRKVAIHDILNYIPEARFRYFTFVIVGISLIIGILIPNIEFVLGLLGSTIGVMICLIFPATFFISINNKNTNETVIAHFIILIGIWILTLGTYANLYAMEESTNVKDFNNNEFHNQIHHIPLKIEGNVLNIPNFKDSKFPLDTKSLEEKISQLGVHPESLVPLDLTKLDKSKEILENVVTIPFIKLNKEPESLKETNEQIKLKEIKSPNNNIFNDNLIQQKYEVNEPIIDKNVSNNANDNINIINTDPIQKEKLDLTAKTDLVKIDNLKCDQDLRETFEESKQNHIETLKDSRQTLNDIKKQTELEKINHNHELMKNDEVNNINPKEQFNVIIPEEDNNVPKKVRDHILGVLTKSMNRDNIVKNITNKGLLDAQKSETIKVQNNLKTPVNKSAPIPIVLQMNNSTLKGKNKVAITVDNEPSFARRDILHKRDREKRYVMNESNVNSMNITNKNKLHIDNDITSHDQFNNCPQNNDNMLNEKDLDNKNNKTMIVNNDDNNDVHNDTGETEKNYATSSQSDDNVEKLIVTNVYLLQQDFTEKTISVTSDVILDTQFAQLKKRDLKALKSDNYPVQ